MGWPRGKGLGYFVGRVGLAQWAEKVKFNLMDDLCRGQHLSLLVPQNVAEESTRVLYSLYGVVEHSGTMRSGHYTAYAKSRTANSRLSDLVLRGDVPPGEPVHFW